MTRAKAGRVLLALLRAIGFVFLVGGSLAILVRPITRFLSHAIGPAVPGVLVPLVPDLLGHAVLLCVVVALTFAMSWFSRQAMAESGLPFDRKGGRLLLCGVGAGAAGMALVIAMIATLGGYVILG